MIYRIINQITESGSFTKAAEKLNMTQSAVSHAMASFEKEIGFSVFQRLKSGIQLTQEGTRLKPLIEALVVAEDRLFNEVNAINAIEVGTLRVGSFASASSRLLPTIIKAYDARYPNISVELFDADYDIIKEKLENGNIDIAVLEDAFLEAHYYALPYLRDELVVVTTNSTAFAKMASFPIKQISDYPFIMPDNDQDTFLKQLLKTFNVVPSVKYRFQLMTTVFAMVEVGLGITIVPESALIKFDYDVIKVSLAPQLYRNVSFVALKKHMQSPVVKAFFEIANEHKIK